MIEKFPKTNLFVMDESLWIWAKYQASLQGYRSVSKYVFELIKAEKEALKGEIFEAKSEDGTYIAIGEPETRDRASLHSPIDDIFRPLLGRRVKVIIKEIKES